MKVETFENEWVVMANDSLCLPQRPVLYGTCEDKNYIVDAVEPIISFDRVIELLKREEDKSRKWWCWVVGWILDILEIFLFAEEMGWYVDTGMFHKSDEYGVSATSLTLKVEFIHTCVFLLLITFS